MLNLHSKSVYENLCNTQDTKATLGMLQEQNSKLKILSNVITDKLETKQRDKLPVKDQHLEDINYFELYRADFDTKALQWCDNEIRKQDLESMREHYYAIKDNQKPKFTKSRHKRIQSM